MITIEIELETADAGHIASALGVDNKGYSIETFSHGNRLICRLEGNDCGALKNAADDVLACVSALGG